MSEPSVNLEIVSDGELLELAVPTESSARRVLVMWLYLRERSQVPLEEFERLLTTLAEKELHRRAGDGKTDH